MAFRTVDITLISAQDLDDVNLFSKTKAYAVAWIQGSQTYDKKKTPLDKENRTNPTWTYPMTFVVEEEALLKGELVLQVEIRSKGTFLDKEIGRVSLLLRDFVKPAEDGGLIAGTVEHVSCQVRNRKPSSYSKGMLNLSIKIGERVDPPAMLYAEGGASAYEPGPSSVCPPPPLAPPYCWHYQAYPAPQAHGVPYPQQYHAYPPQGYPSQGDPPQNQPYPMWRSIAERVVAGTLIHGIINNTDSYGGGCNDING